MTEVKRGVGDDVRDRVRGAFLGLAVGDAVGWPAARHRARVLAPWSRRLERELTAFAEEHEVTTLPVPFALNQPVEPLRIGPSDDAEWLVWTARTVHQDRAEAFGALAGRDDLRARISVRTAVRNLARGLLPPASGHDNPHYFDDAATVRAVVFGAAHPGEPERAATAARIDAQVTNAGDGVHAAAAMAAAIATAVAGGKVAEAVRAALEQMPRGSPLGEVTREALAAARGLRTPLAAVPVLDDVVGDRTYSYAVAAAETLPVALVLTAVAAEAAVGDGPDFGAVSAAACLQAFADSAPALTGAFAGAFGGMAALPETWIEPARWLPGCCLPELAGVDLLAVADRLADQVGAGKGVDDLGRNRSC